MADLQLVRYAVEEGVATLTVDREKVLNALDAQTLDELEAALARAVGDPEVRGVILTGAGEKAFVAGADLKQLATVRHPQEARSLARRGQEVLGRIEASPKPVLACVHGFALGGGLELALACHFRYATSKAKLGLPEVSLGLIPGYGGTQRLARAIGRGPATEAILTGEPMSAGQALRLGLVNQVFETKDEMLEAAGETLRKIGQRGPLAVRLALEAIERGLELGPDDGLRIEADLFGVALASEDAAEGIAAFLGKRAPAFKGT